MAGGRRYHRSIRGNAALLAAPLSTEGLAPRVERPGPGQMRRIPAEPDVDLAGLRSRVGEATERDTVVIDFLEDDLHEARAALAAVGRYLAEIEAALGAGRGGRDQILALALGRGPLERIEYLGGVIGNVRRRLAQVSARLPR